MRTLILICLPAVILSNSQDGHYRRSLSLSGEDIVQPSITLTKPTQGYVWPAPKLVAYMSKYFEFDAVHFKFEVIGKRCPILERAIDRYYLIIKKMADILPISPNFYDAYEVDADLAEGDENTTPNNLDIETTFSLPTADIDESVQVDNLDTDGTHEKINVEDETTNNNVYLEKGEQKHKVKKDDNPLKTNGHSNENNIQQTKPNYNIDKRRSRRNKDLFTSSLENNIVQEQPVLIFQVLYINLKSPCQVIPSHVMDEDYELAITGNNNSILTSNSIWGILRGLETFSQLPYYTDNLLKLRINMTSIKDSPRYPYRGLMLDTSRHYISKENIFKTLDAMAYNKLNVFHWHIVDDQSFPYVSSKFPNMSRLGAYDSKAVYTLSDINDVIKFATDRAIRVIPEFDMPGHVRSWGHAFPELLTQCYNDKGQKTHLGPFNLINPALYSMLYDFFQDIKDVFVDNYLHLGGDEVEYECWWSNPDIKQVLLNNYVQKRKLHNFFFANMVSMLPHRFTPIVWQEVLEVNVSAPKKSIVQMWKDDNVDKFNDFLNRGYRLIYSTCWYLDHLDLGWKSFYHCDPRSLARAHEQSVLGGTACMWGELVDDTNLISRVWPRASATAEVLWSERFPKESEMYQMAERRMEEHACRMRRRGIEAEPPNGPGYCPL